MEEEILTAAPEEIPDWENLYRQLEQKNRELILKLLFVKAGGEDEEYLVYRFQSEASFNEEGALLNGDELLAAAKEKCAAFFKKAAIDGVRPAENTKNPTMGKKEFENLSYAGRVELYHRNPELYGSLVSE